MATVTYSPPTSSTPFMFSDGPETLGQYEDTINGVKETINSAVPCVLLEYRQVMMTAVQQSCLCPVS